MSYILLEAIKSLFQFSQTTKFQKKAPPHLYSLTRTIFPITTCALEARFTFAAERSSSVVAYGVTPTSIQ